MSILYYVGLFSSAIGITLLIMTIAGIINSIINYKTVLSHTFEFIILFIAVLLTVFGIDMLINLDKF